MREDYTRFRTATLIHYYGMLKYVQNSMSGTKNCFLNVHYARMVNTVELFQDYVTGPAK